MALREIMRVPTDKLSMMAASEVGQNGPSVKTEQDGDQPEGAGDQPEAAGDQPETDTFKGAEDNDGGGQDVKQEKLEAMDGGRVATILSKWRKLRTKLICETTGAKISCKFTLIYLSLFSHKLAKNSQFCMTVSV
jgi:hypothetical protein